MSVYMFVILFFLATAQSLYSQQMLDNSINSSGSNRGIEKVITVQGAHNKYKEYTAQSDTLIWIQNPDSIPLATPHRGFGCACDGNHVYILGGDSTNSSGGKMTYVAFSEMQTDGSLGSWRETTPLPLRLWETEAVIYQDYIYIIGGGISDYPYSTDAVYKAQINPDGTLGNWQAQTSLPVGMYGHTAVLYGNRIYVIGDWLNTTPYFSEIDVNGDLGPWNSTTSLSVRLYACDAIVYDTKVFLFGGKEIVGTTQTIVSTVRYAEIYPDGQLGSWQVTDSMPDARWFHQVVQSEDQVFVVGGGEYYGIPEVNRGEIGPDNRISWSSIGNVPEPTLGNGLILSQDRFYYLAGAWSNAVYYATGLPVNIGEDQKQPHLPHAFLMKQNYPNPFNPSTTIEFEITGESYCSQPVNLAVYDIRGRLVKTMADSEFEPGKYRVHWDGRNDSGEKVSSGIYLYRLKTGDKVFTRKMTLSK